MEPVTPSDVTKIISNLPNKKSCGYDGVPDGVLSSYAVIC